MSDRTPSQAVARHQNLVSRVLSCILAQPVPLAQRNPDTINALWLPQRFHWLRGERTLLLSVVREYYLRSGSERSRSWYVEIAAYYYQIYTESC